MQKLKIEPHYSLFILDPKKTDFGIVSSTILLEFQFCNFETMQKVFKCLIGVLKAANSALKVPQMSFLKV